MNSNSNPHGLNLSIVENNPLAVMENMSRMGIPFDEQLKLIPDAPALLQAIYDADDRKCDCSEYIDKTLVPALDVPLLIDGPNAKELIEYSINNLPLLVAINAECVSGKTELVCPQELARLRVMKVGFFVLLGLFVIRFIIKFLRSND